MDKFRTTYSRVTESSWYKLIFFLFVFGYFYYLCSSRIDPDFGWHLRSGQDILGSGIPKYDIYSYTMPQFRAVDHEWLYNIFNATAFKLGGYKLLAAVMAMIWAVSVTVVLRRKQQWFSTALVLLALASYAGVRPIVISFLGLALLEILLANKRRLYFLPLLFLIWVNLHASFSLGIGLFFFYCIYKREKRLFAVWGASFVATLINPYTLRIYEEVIRQASDGKLRWRITEWAPVTVGSSWAVFGYMCIAIGLYGAIYGRKFNKKYVLSLFTFAMALSSTRHMVLFVSASARHLQDLVDKISGQFPKKLAYILPCLGLVVILAIYIGDWIIPKKSAYRGNIESAATYLNAHPCKGNIFNHYNYGGYLIWKLPQSKVYIDGRMPSWSDARGNILQRFIDVIQKPENQKREFAEYDIKCILFPPSTPRSKDKNPKDINAFLDRLLADGWVSVESVKPLNLLIAPATK